MDGVNADDGDAPEAGVAETRTVVAIHVAPESGAPVESRDRVEAVAGRGLRGDRYFADEGTFSASASETPRDVTLVERESLDAVAEEYGVVLEPGEHRRNLTVEGVALDHLVGDRFRVGSAVFEGVERCEPCSYLEGLLEKRGVREALVHRGGIRARVVESGAVGRGDPVTPL
ncbi:MOSC domain-containing protein [Halomarina salina]|uniref:MOSC domain-containing protein n=1 Tax=Halomarina salina TaxID=1872699 RepID=A0ABD5RRP4_9EURY|nr:MOSC domain-containing protein [Halomarina salina]